MILNREYLDQNKIDYLLRKDDILESNQFQIINSNTFNEHIDLVNLVRLSLRDNKLSSLHPTTFRSLINLESLNLGKNN